MIRPRIGNVIKFKHISDFTGQELELTGTIIGDEKAVRKMWPIEMEKAEGCYLVQRKDDFGNSYLHAIFPKEIILILKK